MAGQNSQNGRYKRAHRNKWNSRNDQGHSRFRHTYAAVDLGTHNCRLLVARPTRRAFRVIDAFSRTVRLGEGVEQDGKLCEAAMERTVEALKICASKIKRNRADRIRCVATEACRQAENGPNFEMRVRTELGLELETISCEEEARLALEGCSPLLDRRRPNGLMFDIGGGSTEIMWIDCFSSQSPNLIDMISLPFGVVTLTEEYGTQIDEASRYADIRDRVQEYLARYDSANDVSGMMCRE